MLTMKKFTAMNSHAKFHMHTPGSGAAGAIIEVSVEVFRIAVINDVVSFLSIFVWSLSVEAM